MTSSSAEGKTATTNLKQCFHFQFQSSVKKNRPVNLREFVFQNLEDFRANSGPSPCELIVSHDCHMTKCHTHLHPLSAG